MKAFRTLVLSLLMLFGVMGGSIMSASSASAQAGTPPPTTSPVPGSTQSNGGTFSWSFDGATKAGNKKDLASWEAYFASPDGCWGCDLFSAMATTTLAMGQRGSDLFADNASKALGAFMGVWLIFQLFKLASITHANSPAQGIDEIFNRLMLMVIVMWLLNNNPFQYIMLGIVYPILGDIMTSASSLIGAGGGSCGAPGITGPAASFVGAGSGLMCSMHLAMGKGIGLGAFLIANGEYSVWPGGTFELLRAIGGVIIMLAFGIMLIILPFRLFDALIRIATVSVILPLVIIAYMFKPTRGAVKSAVTSILAAGLTFLFTSIAIAIALTLLNTIVSPVLDPSNYKDLGDANGIGPLSGRQFMIVVAGAVGMATMIMQSGNLAQEFAGFQGQMGGAGAAGAAVAGAAVGFAARGAGAMVPGAGKGVGDVAKAAKQISQGNLRAPAKPAPGAGQAGL